MDTVRCAHRMDRERMGGGCDLDEEMQRGVANADVVLCCLTDNYLSRENCLVELRAARTSGTKVLPLLMPGYTRGHDDDVSQDDIEARGRNSEWPPLSSKELEPVKAQFARTMYIDMRTRDGKFSAANFQRLIHSIDEIVRGRRAERRLCEAVNAVRVSITRSH